MDGMQQDEKYKMKMEWKNHMAMRTLTAVIVIIFVFWCGFQFGEIRASVGGEHGYRMMQGGWGGNIEYGGMMAPYGVTTGSASAVPATAPATK
jgi:hypothetical protein